MLPSRSYSECIEGNAPQPGTNIKTGIHTMSDAAVDHFIEQKVTAIASWGDYLTGSDKVAAEQLTKGVSNKGFTSKEREDFMQTISNEAAAKHLPGLELINARDTDGNGKADQFAGVKLN